MERNRKFTRMQGYSASCIVVKQDGSTWQATLENISIGGAMVKVSERGADGLKVGENCTVTLCGGSGPLAAKYTCQVMWCDFESVGIQFIATMNPV